MNSLKAVTAVVLMAVACVLLSCGSLRHNGETRPRMKADNGKKVEASQIVDLGLESGTMWAGWNIGANSPEKCGSYFAWGEVNAKQTFNWDNYSDLESIVEDKQTFKTFQPDVIRTIMGNPDADAATAAWGEHWAMPSKAQIDELLRECQWTWTSLKGQRGFVVKGPNGRSIFLPAGGCYFENSSLSQFGKTCFYWCGELDDSGFFDSRAFCLIMLQKYPKYYDRNGERCDGKPIRAVYRP